jgi:hypothetical protein
MDAEASDEPSFLENLYEVVEAPDRKTSGLTQDIFRSANSPSIDAGQSGVRDHDLATESAPDFTVGA